MERGGRLGQVSEGVGVGEVENRGRELGRYLSQILQDLIVIVGAWIIL